MISGYFKHNTKIRSEPDLKYAVSYERVSSKEQLDGKPSIGHQRQSNREFAEKEGFQIIEHFGGTYESAKTDGRAEFNRMLKFVKQNPNVKYIIVWKLDRFSRTGSGALGIISDLKYNYQVDVISSTEKYDPETPSGTLHQNMLLIISHFENQQRTERTIIGMQARMKAGYPFGRLPLGYVRDRNQDKIFQDRNAVLINRAFQMISQGYSLTEMKQELSKQGLNLGIKRWSKTLRNPLYCGVLVNSLLQEPVMAKVDPIVSQKLFIEVNEILKGNRVVRASNDHLYFKQFVKCPKCGNYLTGYDVKKKNRWLKRKKVNKYWPRKTILSYYKCGTPGCRVNVSQKKMEASFLNVLDQLVIDPDDTMVMAHYMAEYLEHLSKDQVRENRYRKRKVAKLEERIRNLELKYIDDLIDEKTYRSFKTNFIKEKAQLETTTQRELSNPTFIINKALRLCSNMRSVWLKSSFSTKRELQKLIFPEGIIYDKVKEEYRTPVLNSVFNLIVSFSDRLGMKKGDYMKEVSFGSP